MSGTAPTLPSRPPPGRRVRRGEGLPNMTTRLPDNPPQGPPRRPRRDLDGDGRAVLADPVFRWLTPDDEHRRRILPAFFELAPEIFARTTRSGVLASRHDGRRIDLVARPVSTRWTRHDGEPFELAAPSSPGRTPAAGRTSSPCSTSNHPPRRPRLPVAARRPARPSRDTGLGTSDDARRGRSGRPNGGCPPTCEATSRENLRLYERHGFLVTGELAVTGGPRSGRCGESPAPRSTR